MTLPPSRSQSRTSEPAGSSPGSAAALAELLAGGPTDAELAAMMDHCRVTGVEILSSFPAGSQAETGR